MVKDDEEYLENLLNSVINNKDNTGKDDDELSWIDQELQGNTDDMEFDSFINSNSSEKKNSASQSASNEKHNDPQEEINTLKDEVVPHDEAVPHDEVLSHDKIMSHDEDISQDEISLQGELSSQDDITIPDEQISKDKVISKIDDISKDKVNHPDKDNLSKESVQRTDSKKQNESNQSDSNVLDMNDMDLSDSIPNDDVNNINDIINNMNSYDNELSEVVQQKQDEKSKRKEEKEKKKEEKQKKKEEKEILKQKNQDNKNKKKDDQDKLNGIDSDLVLQDIGIEEHRNSNHERNNKGDVFEEIPIKKESFLKKIFKKHPNKKQSDTNELDSNEVFDETGSTLDDMQNLSMNDLDLDNGLFNDNNSKNRRIRLNTADEEDEEEDTSKKKGKKVKEKKPKKEKQPKEKKIKNKKIKKPVSRKEIIKISPLGCILISTIVLGSIIALLIFSTNLHYKDNIDKATKYYVDQKYTEAYTLMAGMKLKSQDKDFYKQVENIMKVQKHENDFNNYIKLEKYPEALESLLRGIKSFDKNINASAGLGTSDIQNNLMATINSQLQSYFGLTEDDARSILQIEDKKEYTKMIYEKAANIKLTEEGNK